MTPITSPATSSLAADILACAVDQPAAPALRWRGNVVTYAELAELGRQAHQGLVGAAGTDQEGGPVAVVAKKSPEAIATILACGLARRPVLIPSPDLGGHALDLLVERAGCRQVATVTGAGTQWKTVRSAAEVRVGERVSFLLTTSGSTGVPKIVPLEADAVRQFIGWAATEFGLGRGVNVLNYAPLNFDLCLLDVWATLRAGGCVTLVESDHAVNPRYLLGLLRDNDVQVVQAVPMFFRILAEAAEGGAAYPSVRHVLLTGDHTPRRLRAALPELFPSARFHNVYGCTETNDSFMYSFDGGTAASDEVLPLGRPLPGVRAMVMTDDGPLSGPGSGELWVSTPFQTRGYLHGGGDRFVPHPTGAAGSVYYRTGDVVSRDNQDVLTLIGRTDFQVKVRGVRVNLEEIERVILEHEDVVEVGVVAIPDAEAGHRLYAVARRGSDRLTGLLLRQHCATWLPRAAIPSDIRVIDENLPITSTGKVDRNRIKADLQEGKP